MGIFNLTIPLSLLRGSRRHCEHIHGACTERIECALCKLREAICLRFLTEPVLSKGEVFGMTLRVRLLRRGVYPEVGRRASRNDENAVFLCNDTPQLAAGFSIKSIIKVLNSVFSILFVAIIIESISYASTANQSETIVTDKELIILDKWNEKQLDYIISESSKIHDLDIRIDFLSEQFLNVDYKESTLIGNINTPEVFVVNLQGVDCFTYIDYVEAMRLSNSFPEFKDKLRTIRYQYGNVDFLKRNHFFTDWEYFNSEYVEDVTEKIGGDKTKTVLKTLNDKNDGTYFIPGISPKKRKIHYISSDAFDNEMLSKLRSGDYIGIYSNQDGLDVSHVGIVIKEGDKFYFRHASSSEGNRKVIDEDFMNYISDKPGILILRPK